MDKTYDIQLRTKGGNWRRVAGPFKTANEYGALRYYLTHYRHLLPTDKHVQLDEFALRIDGTTYQAVEVET